MNNLIAAGSWGWRWLIGATLAWVMTSCAADDPVPTDIGVGDVGARDGAADALPDGGADQGTSSCAPSFALPDVGGDDPTCGRGAQDYAPGEADDGYAACVSDDGSYHRIESSIGSIGRVAGFDKIVALLLTDGEPPTKQAFVDARLIYTEAEGLASRVSRREDEHYPAAAKKCAEMSADEIASNAHRCVGQARIQPLLNEAFAAGSEGRDPWVNAARIEAALLWFLYVSVHKEATTCTDKRKDCDSSYAYYTGGEDGVDAGLGLARYVRGVSAQAHGAVWQGVLAVRCWRDLDQAVPGEDLALRDRAIAQLDRALLRGVALITKARLVAFKAAGCQEARRALWATVKILGGALDREASDRDAQEGSALREALAKPQADADADATLALIGSLFPCPW